MTLVKTIVLIHLLFCYWSWFIFVSTAFSLGWGTLRGKYWMWILGIPWQHSIHVLGVKVCTLALQVCDQRIKKNM